MKKKFILTNETSTINGRTVYRIKAERDFGTICKGDLGGFVSDENRLSQYGDCWITGNACVFDSACVTGNAVVSGNAVLRDCAVATGNAKIHGKAMLRDCAYVSGNARITGSSFIGGRCRVAGNVYIAGNAMLKDGCLVIENVNIDGNAKVGGATIIKGNAIIGGYAVVGGKALIGGNVRIIDAHVNGDVCITNTCMIYGNADISSQSDILYIGRTDSMYHESITFCKTTYGNIIVACGGFKDTIENFAKMVEEQYGNNKHGKLYKLAIEMAKIQILQETEEVEEIKNRQIYNDCEISVYDDGDKTRYTIYDDCYTVSAGEYDKNHEPTEIWELLRAKVDCYKTIGRKYWEALLKYARR